MPRPTILAIVRVIWLALCLLVLLFAWNHRDTADTDLVVLWALMVLTFPVALVISALGTGLFMLLERFAGLVVPGGFWFNLTYWMLSVGIAYWFWFKVIPRLAGRHER
jgi:hypothetical protein